MQFLWKGIHNAHKAGAYWVHIPECGDHAICAVCETLESLKHILIHCDCPRHELIWGAAKALWLEKESHWPEVSLGSILGCGLAEFRDDGGKAKHGTQRLYQILMSESAYLIWRIRNDRVIGWNGVPTSDDEIINKWKFVVNQRLQMDKLLANRPCRGKHCMLAPKLVIDTWSNTMDDERSLPDNWLKEPRVLVGSCVSPWTPTRRRDSQGIG
ncbi:hypothetical protein B0H10DRAFT_1774729 [Mycena sp. CBHHK59/15]|nr:hypothetical protein B0H10DRAFT_1774729 [Mycena sp. CBHHK59/15]